MFSSKEAEWERKKVQDHVGRLKQNKNAQQVIQRYVFKFKDVGIHLL